MNGFFSHCRFATAPATVASSDILSTATTVGRVARDGDVSGGAACVGVISLQRFRSHNLQSYNFAKFATVWL